MVRRSHNAATCLQTVLPEFAPHCCDACHLAVDQNQWYHFGVGAPPILEPILVGIGMFTGGTIWTLTHGHLRQRLSARRYAEAARQRVARQSLVAKETARQQRAGDVSVEARCGTDFGVGPNLSREARFPMQTLWRLGLVLTQHKTGAGSGSLHVVLCFSYYLLRFALFHRLSALWNHLSTGNSMGGLSVHILLKSSAT